MHVFILLPGKVSLHNIQANHVGIFVVFGFLKNLKSIVIIFNTEFDVITEYPMIISDTHFTAGLPVTAVILLCIFTQQFCFRYRFVLFSIFGQSLNVMTPQLITFILLYTSPSTHIPQFSNYPLRPTDNNGRTVRNKPLPFE